MGKVDVDDPDNGTSILNRDLTSIVMRKRPITNSNTEYSGFL